MESEAVLLATILPVTYMLVDMLKTIPGIQAWWIPFMAIMIGGALGVLWAFAGADGSTSTVMIYAILGAQVGGGATGFNQVKKQSLKAQGYETQDAIDPTARGIRR